MNSKIIIAKILPNSWADAPILYDAFPSKSPSADYDTPKNDRITARNWY